MRIERNMVKDVMEKLKATREEMIKMSKAASPSNVGVPCPSFTPPGRVVAEVKATAEISAATIEHDSDVLVSQFLASSTRFVCVSVKPSFGVWRLSLKYVKNWRGIES